MARITDHVVEFFTDHPDLDTRRNRMVVSAVNHEIDQFAHYPNMEFLKKHRRYLHHREGVEYFEKMYGRLGRLAAEHHIRMDCEGYIPRAVEYYDRTVNEFGLRRRHFIDIEDLEEPAL